MAGTKAGTTRKRKTAAPPQPEQTGDDSIILTQDMIDKGRAARAALFALNHLMTATLAMAASGDDERRDDLRPLWGRLTDAWREARDAGVFG